MAPKLLKFYTDAKALRLFVLTLSLGFSTQVALADSELSASLDVTHANNCQANVSEVTRTEQELNAACREAGLGSRNACIQTLAECEGENASENDQCVDGMTPEGDIQDQREALEAKQEDMERIQEEIQAQQTTITELEQQAIEVNRAKGVARANLNEALTEIGTQRAQLQSQLNADLEQLEIAVEEAKNNLVQAEFRFRQFVLQKVGECNEESDRVAQTRYNGYRERARQGSARYSQAELFGMTGMSVREVARTYGRRAYRECLRQVNSARNGGNKTEWGMQYELQRDMIDHEKRVLNTAIQNMEQKAVSVQAAHEATRENLSRAESAQIDNYQSEVLALNQEGARLVRAEQVALQRINDLQFESVGLMLDINSMEDSLQRSHGGDIRVASDETVRAYREAHQASDSLLSAARRAESGAASCNQQDFIAGILRAFELAEEAVARDVASPEEEDGLPTIDVEVEDADPTPAPVAAEGVEPSGGQTVN